MFTDNFSNMRQSGPADVVPRRPAAASRTQVDVRLHVIPLARMAPNAGLANPLLLTVGNSWNCGHR